MSQLSVDSLVGDSHKAHDDFVRTYVKTNNGEDCVEVALRTRTTRPQSEPRGTEPEEPNLYSFVADKLRDRSSSPNTVMKRIHHLALYILLTQYPQQWNALFEAAYTLLVGLLDIICNPGGRPPKDPPLIYPPRWTQEIFRLENKLTPDSLQGIIFGTDPISKDGDLSNAGTGYAFTFDYQRLMTNFATSSTQGLQEAYCLKKGFAPSPTQGLVEAYCLKRAKDYAINSSNLEKDLMKSLHGIGMVHFIRTIKQGSRSGSANAFLKPWIAYNNAWLTFMQKKWESTDRSDRSDRSDHIDRSDSGVPRCIDSGRVLIFQNEHYPFDNFAGTENDPSPHFKDFGDVKKLLQKVPRCSHPSYIRANVNHCLVKPSTFYKWYPRYGLDLGSIDDNRCNESVIKFVAFLDQRGAQTAYHCQCRYHRDEAQEVLIEHVKAMILRDSERPDDLNQTGDTTTLSISDVSSCADASTAEQHLTTTSTDEEASDLSTDTSVNVSNSVEPPSTMTSTDEVSVLEQSIADPVSPVRPIDMSVIDHTSSDTSFNDDDDDFAINESFTTDPQPTDVPTTAENHNSGEDPTMLDLTAALQQGLRIDSN